MPHSSSIYSISSEDTIPIREAHHSQHHHHHNNRQQHPQADSLISQDPHAITFSTASPTILPMTDHTQHHDIDIRDLHSRLARVEQQQHQQQIHTDNATFSQRGARSSLDSTIMPRFTKSSTMSTTDTNSTTASASSHLHADPTCRLHPETVGLGPGTFSKPRVPPRSRRDAVRSSSGSSIASGSTTGGGGKGKQRAQQPQPQFKYYGRHGNQWLFNDFSVTDAVAKGFKKVFPGADRKADGGDWYEDRK